VTIDTDLATPHRSSADYIDRTIATVRNHRNADNCWPQWANIFADEIEDLRAELSRLREEQDAALNLLDGMTVASRGWERDFRAAEARLGEAQRECVRLQQALAPLVTLVRIGFLVTVNGERAGSEVVKDPATREILFAILKAKDTAAAVEALAGPDTPAYCPTPVPADGTTCTVCGKPADSQPEETT